MEFNKVIRGANRAIQDIDKINEILDAGFLCHISFQHEGQTMMIPTAYGRKDNCLYLHGSTKNFMFKQILDGQTICIGITHLDGIVLAKTLFDTSVNYRSVILFGKAELVENTEERNEGLKIITNNIINGRWEEVPIGSENELKATMVVKFKIERLSAKVREAGPEGDEDKPNEVWSGHIPLVMKALKPIQDLKFGKELEMTNSVKEFWEKNL
jgi:nitroimidazol reductase NimA-like FMN-containing flavoprotein (pyridoxamine 5'-phosphate oxidase superfamily)